MPHRDIVNAASSESARLAAITDYNLELSRPEAEFDHVVDLASSLFNVPISLISLVESERQFLAAPVGLDVCSNSTSFCRIACRRSFFAERRPALNACGRSRTRHSRKTWWRIDGDACHLNTSIGIAQSPGDGESIETLLASADMALYRAKASGGGASEIFCADLKQQAERRRTMQAELRRAFEDNQFELFWQPQVDMRTTETVGTEVLLRWRHPTLGLRSPGEFLPVLDKMLLANEVGDWAIRTTLGR